MTNGKLTQNSLTKVAEKWKSRFDRARCQGQNFKIGDYLAFSQEHRRLAKLYSRFRGPYVKKKVYENDGIQQLGENTLLTTAKDQLKMYPMAEKACFDLDDVTEECTPTTSNKQVSIFHFTLVILSVTFGLVSQDFW